MSSGQKAWEDEKEADARQAHIARLQALGYSRIADLIDDISFSLQSFESSNPSLPRASWRRIDAIKEKVGMLK